MANNKFPLQFRSPVAPLIKRLIQEKQAVGYKYQVGALALERLDRFLAKEGLAQCELPRELALKWLAKRPHESAANHGYRGHTLRRLAIFMVKQGYAAHVPDPYLMAKGGGSSFSPRILTHAEVRRLLDVVDHFKPSGHSPLRHLVMPEVFRLLYGCGLRVGEVLHLKVGDVDFGRGVLTLRETKFGKDRQVPPAVSLVQRLQKFDQELGRRPANAYFFPNLRGGHWAISSVYGIYRKLLTRSGISHAGRGKGPRVHDLRHTFAVHSLLRWYRQGADLDAKLPVLATYMGHLSVVGTQHYLHLTAELFPEITTRSQAHFGDVIPRRVVS
ncbi:MAG: tyrosine-type recombinase/integrase [Sulfuricaulis sp.]|uniref:tyrosine-type recombinase/integrase n=1 Tax=Sulfuricaulis sp. TaxID=2003553 RepID=UPI0034A58C3A